MNVKNWQAKQKAKASPAPAQVAPPAAKEAK
jgi:hypothetical protein